jgi:hypothetical protein
MSNSFSGMISTENKDPKNHKHTNVNPEDSIDPRIFVVKEYLLKVPNASLKDLKKALTGFSKASEEELKNIIRSADETKFNELFPQMETIQTSINITNRSKFYNEEIQFLEKYRNSSLKRRNIYSLYKKEFPSSARNINFLSDYYYHYKETAVKVKKGFELKEPKIQPTHKVTNEHVLAQAIVALYKSGKSPKTFSKIKPVIELIKDPNAIEFAIECLTL